MFEFLAKSLARRRGTVATRARLCLEALEPRYCLSAYQGLSAAQLTGLVAPPSSSSSAPVITSFQARHLQADMWIFTGQVQDASLAGIVVSFGGLTSLQGQSATVDSNGWFTLTVQLQPGESGTATAQATDALGLVSNVAICWVVLSGSESH